LENWFSLFLLFGLCSRRDFPASCSTGPSSVGVFKKRQAIGVAATHSCEFQFMVSTCDFGPTKWKKQWEDANKTARQVTII